jgi:hypothetical protein
MRSRPMIMVHGNIPDLAADSLTLKTSGPRRQFAVILLPSALAERLYLLNKEIEMLQRLFSTSIE